MADQRYLPFGYQIQDGKIQITPGEGELVPKIFTSYLFGSTMQKIADGLQLTGVPYSKSNPMWSKNMVHRILNNRKYCGEKGFPALIDPAVFEETTKRKQQRRVTPLPDMHLFRKHMVCATCNGKLKLDLGTRGKIFWKCTFCGLRIGPITNDFLTNVVIAAMNYFIRHPDNFHATSQPTSLVSIQTEKLDREFERVLDQPFIDVARAVSLLFARTQLQYEFLEPILWEPNTLKLRQLYSGHSPLTEIDPGLFRESVQDILMSPARDVQLRFINGQIYPE